MLLHFYAFGLLLLATLPAVLMTQNLPLFRRLPNGSCDAESSELDSESVSVLIPARNEQASIGECLQHVLACRWPWLEVIVLDDGSTDQTLPICQAIAAADARLRVVQGQELPLGWNGKQYACWQLAEVARGTWLLFIDADVRLSSGAIPALVEAAKMESLDLYSGFPRQITLTFFERLLIPLVHFILLGYLPIAMMRASNGPEFAAGCGQLFLARRSAYFECDGHRSIAGTRHDGVKLPRSFRLKALRTDIFDASEIASCRMYASGGEVIRGLMKNATEGIGSPRTIVPFTILLAAAAVLPLASLVAGVALGWNGWILAELSCAAALSYYPRLLAAKRFEQSLSSVALHPVAVAVLLAIQWTALTLESLGFRTRWRGRAV